MRIRSDDIEVHRTRNTPKCATVVLLDMSGSMRYGGLYVDVKRMGLALDGLIRREYPGDFLQFVEIYSFAKPRQASEVVTLLPKPVTIFEPVVRLRADMSDPNISELSVPAHFTNIQHGLRLARQFLGNQDTPNRQVILITDGLPTAHFEGQMLYLLYPPDRATEEATMREGHLCHREGITINTFLLNGWSQSREDVQFAYRLAESTTGRVFFTAGKDLDRYVVWDYVNRRAGGDFVGERGRRTPAKASGGRQSPVNFTRVQRSRNSLSAREVNDDLRPLLAFVARLVIFVVQRHAGGRDAVAGDLTAKLFAQVAVVTAIKEIDHQADPQPGRTIVPSSATRGRSS